MKMRSIGGEWFFRDFQNMDDNLSKLHKLREPQFKYAKSWWSTAQVFRILILVVSFFSIFFPQITHILSAIAGFFVGVQVLSQLRADLSKRIADAILREIEFADGLGWEISGKEVAEIKLSVSNRVRNQAENSNLKYYSSPSQPSKLRLMENLEESSFFTAHQAKSMFRIVSIFAISVLVLAIITLVVSLQRGLNQPLNIRISSLVITVIVFIFSAGYIQLAFNYWNLSNQAQNIDDKAHRMLQSEYTEFEAIKLLHNYHILRANSPMIPSWLWNLKENDYNRLWEEYRARG